MAQSEKIFRDMLCERRSLPVETNDPSSAKTIDELKKLVKELRNEVEAEKLKVRQTNRDHERKIRCVREEAQRKLEVTVESSCVRKDLERLAEIKKLEEKLEKQRIQEVQALDKERAEELIKHQRKWQREKEEAVRIALEAERRKFGEETQHMYQRDEVHARESKLAREVFILEEHNEKLEEQVQSLKLENKTKIELLRKMRHQYDNELEGVIKQHQNEAARDMAQLRLAEQLISEREHVLHSVEYKADMAVLEKEALEEELIAMKSERNMSMVSNASMTGSPPSGRKSVGGSGGGVLQKRVDDLERTVKKLEEEKSSLKQENASLRKKLIHETGGVGSGGEGAGGKVNEEKTKTLRKRNAELVALAKQLDERCKALKMENDQLQKQSSTPGDTEQQIRKSLARQHTKDIMDYTRQITMKDREISDLKRKLVKFEVITPTRPEPCPELERKLKAHSIEKLRMEKLIAKLYSKLPDMVEVGVSRHELEAESTHTNHLEEENKSLKQELEQLHQSISQGDEVDYQQERDTHERQMKSLEDENKRIKDQLSSMERDHSKLIESSEQSTGELEQRCHGLSKQLEVSQLAVKELQSNAEQCSLLERQVELLTTQLAARDTRVHQLETECEGQRSLVESREKDIDGLKVELADMETLLNDKDSEYTKLQTSIVDLRPPPKPTMVDVYQQTEPVQSPVQSSTIPSPKQSADVPVHVGSKVSTDCEVGGVKISRTSAVSAVSHGNTSLDTEMKALGLEVTDSFDSSEGVGFSEVNLDDSAQSVDDEKLPLQSATSNEHIIQQHTPQQLTHESSKPLQSADQTPGTETQQDTSADSAVVPISTLVDSQLSAMVVMDTPTEQQALPTQTSDRDEIEEELSPSSSHDCVEEPATVQAVSEETANVAIFIAKFTYTPSEMSPNPNFDLELPLTAGDYLYVYGEMDADGFYHGQLMNGQSGLVPSNFIERVMDDDENSPQPPRKPMRRRLSNLQDIVEEDEETSSGDSLAPPTGLEMDQQLVDEHGYSIAMHWNKPHPLPTHITGYNVYINGALSDSVSGADQTTLLLKGVPRKQLVKISVRTTTEGGESPDPKQLIILNPQYPQPPTELELSKKDDPVSLLVTWSPAQVLEGGNTITGYSVYINNQCCVKLAAHPGPVDKVCAQLLPGDVERLQTSDTQFSLTVRSVSHDYESIDSAALLVSADHMTHLLRGGGVAFTGGPEAESSTSSQTSITSSEEDRQVYSPAKMISELQQSNSDHVIQSESHVTPNEGHVTNGNPDSFTEDIDSGGSVPVMYYRATYSYDPLYQSPNETDEASEELTFQEGDVIMVSGDVDEDGYLKGELNGRVGFIPSNMVELITDTDELTQIKATLAVHSRRRGQQSLNGVEKSSPSSKRMRALFDYDPEQDSPNENSEVELTFTEGDIVTVFGSPDQEGFYKAELSGKQGLVPHNFLEEVLPDDNDDSYHDNEGVEVFAADEESMHQAQQILNTAVTGGKKKRGILSQGKSLITRSLGKKTN